MNLSEAISTMHTERTPEANKSFVDAFRELVNTNALVYTSVKKAGNGYAIDTAEHAGSVYTVMFSDSGQVKHEPSSSTATIYLPSLIDSTYANAHIAGIVINPFDKPVYMQRKDLQVLSGKPDPRLAKRDWGEGIPEYSESDLMVAEEALDFAMEIVAEYGLKDSGFEVVETNNGLTAFPNYVLMREGEMYFVSVDVTVAPKVPSLSEELKKKIVEIASRNGAKALYAPVSFSSADSKRMEKGLALVGDSFIGNFIGFFELH